MDTKSEFTEEYLHCAMDIGEQMLMSGAEVSRVEDAIRRICLSAGASRVDVLSITASIITTAHLVNGKTFTESRRITASANNMDKLDQLNDLCRRICSTHPAPQKIQAEIRQINDGRQYPYWIKVCSYALVSGSFCVLFGGSWRDMIASALIGILLKMLESVIRRRQVNAMLNVLLISLAGGVLSRLSVLSGLAGHADLVSYGNIMLFIPGVAFTNSLRDLFIGDTITGSIRLLESLLQAIVIAAGFTFAHYLF